MHFVNDQLLPTFLILFHNSASFFVKKLSESNLLTQAPKHCYCMHLPVKIYKAIISKLSLKYI